MSENAYTVLSLAMRYVFLILCILIVLQAYYWLIHERRVRHMREKQLPDAGWIGTMTVLTDTEHLPRGTSFRVPWEGTMGSARSCDLFIPGNGVARQHVFFSLDPAQGLCVEPVRSQVCMVDHVEIRRKTAHPQAFMQHGSTIQIGDVHLKLRCYDGVLTGTNTGKNIPRRSRGAGRTKRQAKTA